MKWTPALLLWSSLKNESRSEHRNEIAEVLKTEAMNLEGGGGRLFLLDQALLVKPMAYFDK